MYYTTTAKQTEGCEGQTSPIQQKKDLKNRYKLAEPREYKKRDLILGNLIGKGNFSWVYLAKNFLNGSKCAVKVIDLSRKNNQKAFDREAIVLEVLREKPHDNIVKVLGVDEQNASGYFILELLPRATLSTWIIRNGPFEEKEALNITTQLASALYHLHVNGISHCDVKPENISYDGNKIKLFDFGLSIPCDPSHPYIKDSVGSPLYTAPEVLTKSAEDIHNPFIAEAYSVGVVLHEMITGLPPHSKAKTFPQLLILIEKSPLNIPAYLQPKTKAILMGLLEKNHESRMTLMQLIKLLSVSEEKPQLIIPTPSLEQFNYCKQRLG